MQPIGILHSCFREKFGIPRQPGLVAEARARLELFTPFGTPEALAGLEGFSHLWLIFVFHQALQANSETGIAGQWQPSVRPPRLGGNRKVGVFASRSPFRPNAIGLSVVKLESMDCTATACTLHLSGVDILDGTPVLDIKPYVPYADALPQARAGFADEPPAADIAVEFTDAAAEQCVHWELNDCPGLRALIEQLLALDPRPAYKAGQAEDPARIYGMRLYHLDVRWQVQADRVLVLELAIPG